MTLKQQQIEELAIKAKNGDKEATAELLKIFNPLICRISENIYIRYEKLFPLEEIIRQARCILIQLTVLTYTPGGKAHYPYFIRKKLHAELVQLYRPFYNPPSKIVSLESIQYKIQMPTDTILNNERIEIYEELIKYANTIFNEREKDIIENVICGHIPRNELARKYHISFTRMKTIHKHIIKKLKQYLSKIGITKMRDI